MYGKVLVLAILTCLLSFSITSLWCSPACAEFGYKEVYRFDEEREEWVLLEPADESNEAAYLVVDILSTSFDSQGSVLVESAVNLVPQFVYPAAAKGLGLLEEHISLIYVNGPLTIEVFPLTSNVQVDKENDRFILPGAGNYAEWRFIYTVTNLGDTKMTDIQVSQNFSAELDVKSVDGIWCAVPTKGQVKISYKGSAKKFDFFWDGFELEPGESASLTIDLNLGKNPAGKQHYGECGKTYTLTSTAVLKYRTEGQQGKGWKSYEGKVFKVWVPCSQPSFAVKLSASGAEWYLRKPGDYYVPRGVSGGRYGAVAISPAETGGGGQAPFQFRMASFIELQIIGGATRREAFIANVSVLPSSEVPSIRQQVGDRGLVYTAEVTNAGNVHIVAKGSLVIQTEEGRTVARYPLGGGRGVIIPEATVALRSVTGRNLPPGNYRARVMVDYGGRRPLVAEAPFAITETQVAGSIEHDKPLSRLVIDPDELEITTRAGAFTSSIVELTNRGDEPMEIASKILPLGYSLQGDFLPEEERGAAPDWVEVNPESFTLPPGRSRRVRLSMRPPKDADGGYYFDLVFRSDNQEAAVESGANILLFVGDEVIKAGQVEIANLQLVEQGAVVDVLFTNLGNYHLHTVVDFALRRVYPEYVDEETGRVVPRQTETIAAISLPADTNPVLPGTERLYSFEVPANWDSGEYELAVRVDYGGEEPAVAGLLLAIEGSNGSDD